MHVYSSSNLPVSARRLMNGLWRRRWRAVAVAWGVAALIWAAVLLAPQTYQSRAHVYAEPGPATDPAAGDAGLHAYYRQRIDAMRLQLLTRPQLEKIAARAGFDAPLNDRTDDARLAGMDRLTQRVADSLSVESPAAMHLVISYRDPDRETALAGAEAALDVLMEQDFALPSGGNDAEDRRWDDALTQRIAEQEAKIAQNEQALAALKSDRAPAPAEGGDTKASDPSGETAAPASERRAALRRANEELASARARLTDLLNRASVMASVMASGDAMTGAGSDVMRLRFQLAELRARSPASVAEILTIEARIARLEESSGRLADGDYVRLQTDLQAALDSVALLKARRNVLRDALNAPSGVVAEAASAAVPDPAQSPEPAASVEAQKLQNDQRALKSAHAALASLREQAPTTPPSMGGVAYTVIEPPRAALSPLGPSRAPLVLGGLFVAVAAGLTVAAVRAAFDDRFSDAAALENAVGRPVIGAIGVAPSAVIVAARKRDRTRFAAACVGLLLAGAVCAWFVASPSSAAPPIHTEAPS